MCCPIESIFKALSADSRGDIARSYILCARREENGGVREEEEGKFICEEVAIDVDFFRQVCRRIYTVSEEGFVYGKILLWKLVEGNRSILL